MAILLESGDRLLLEDDFLALLEAGNSTFGAVALTGTGTLTAVGVRVVSGAAALTGTATLAASGSTVRYGAAALTGEATLSGSGSTDGTITYTGAAALTGTATLTVAGSASSTLTGAASLTGTATMLVRVGALIDQGAGQVRLSLPSTAAVSGESMTTTATVRIGNEARVEFVFLDADHAPSTPSSITITARSPSGVDTTVTNASAAVTLGAVFPLLDRQHIAYELPMITAASIADGTGCVEYLHEPDEEGLWIYRAVDDTGNAAPVAYCYAKAAFS